MRSILVLLILAFPVSAFAIKDCPHCPELVRVPAGKYVMGTPEGEEARRDREGPQHEVTIAKAFLVGKFEVTIAEFAAFMKASPFKISGCRWWNRSERKWQVDSEMAWDNPPRQHTDRDPVQCISWNDAEAYIDWLARETGKKYRFLTEAEWEYAARAGTTSPFYFGDKISTDQANFGGEWRSPYKVGKEDRGRAIAVGSFPPNKFGLHDMHGNAAEWVRDCATKKSWRGYQYYTWTDARAFQRNNNCRRRVVRGGTWFTAAHWLRSGARGRFQAGRRYLTLGLRVARDEE